MTRSLISVLAAAAIGLSGLAPAPALAQDRQEQQEGNPNAAAWMLGIAAAAILASKLRDDHDDKDDDKDDKKDPPKAAPAKNGDARSHGDDWGDWRDWRDDHDRPGRGVGHWRGNGAGHDHGRGRGHDRDDADRVASNRLPDRCLTRDSAIRVYGRECMGENYRFARALPDRCLVTFDGDRHGYVPDCLTRYGFLREED